MSPILISLEGNIGSGKSTLLRAMKAAHPEWHFVDEPVDQWLAMKNEAGESLLELFYKDKRRWSYTFQNAALLTRVANLKKTLESLPLHTDPMRPTVVIMERSIDTDAFVFAKLLHDDGFMDGLEMDLYKKWYTMISKDVPVVDGYIHLDTPVTLCAERIRGRARDGEDAIPLEYLDKLDSAHFAWLRRYEFPWPVIRFDNYSPSPKDQTTLQDVEEWVRRLWLGRMD
jgi:deoxyguanosine kinase